MTTVYFDIIVSGDKEETWKSLENFAGISIFHPFIHKSYAINGSSDTGPGAERRCELSTDGKKYLDERIVRFVDGKEFDVEISGGNPMPPVRNLIGTMGMESLTSKQHRIYLKTTYEPKFGLFGKILDMITIKPLVSNRLKTVLVGFKHYIETGHSIQSVRTLKTAGLIA